MFRTIANKGVFACALALIAFVPVVGAKATTFQVLHNFSGQDGEEPSGGLIADKAGNLYGVTMDGGSYEYGTVFELAPDGTESVLYSFTFGNNGVDGYWPLGALLKDKAGNLYGATFAGGGSADCGTIFKLAPSGVETVLYAFKGGSDGCSPRGSLIADKRGKLYGTTSVGGDYTGYQCEYYGCGTVFRLSPDGKKTVLHAFQGASDGAFPNGPLISDASGNLYGTSYGPGQYDSGCNSGIGPCGTVFKLAPDGTETVLYAFCTQKDCPDGYNPAGGLIADSAGNLYGTTNLGGVNGWGTVFELTANGTETSLYSFGAGAGGSDPLGTLAADKQGNLYGVTSGGGGRGCKGYGCGVVFEVTPNGTETVLHDFKLIQGGDPTGSLISMDGNLYGTTKSGGPKGCSGGCGTVFAVRK